MSKSNLIVAAAAVAFMFSCASAPVPKAPAAPTAPAVAQAAPSGPSEPAPVKPSSSVVAVPEKKAPRVVVVRIPLETKSSVLFADGTLDGYTVSERDGNGFLSAQTRHTASGTPVERVEYAYKAGKLETKTTKDGEGKLVSRRVYVLGADGLVLSEFLEDAGGKRLSSFEYSYDSNGKRSSWIVKDGKNTLIAETVYGYKDGILRNAELRDGMGRKTGSSTYEYGGDRLVQQRFYDAVGTLLRTETTSWNNGKVVLEERKSAGGAVLQRTTYEYGADGELLKKTFEDVVGKNKLITKYEYAVKEERKTVQD